MRCRFILRLILCAVAGFVETAPPSRAADAPAQSSPRPLAEFPIEQFGETITISTPWQGKEACFVFDTGAAGTLVDPKIFPGLKPIENVKITTTGGARSMQTAEAPDLRVGASYLPNCGPVYCMDMTDIRALTGRPIIGILGVSAMKFFTVQMDFDEHRLRILFPDNQLHPEWGRSFPIEVDSFNNLLLKLSVGGIERTLYVDSGASGVISLPSDVFDRVRDGRLPIASIPTATANGTVILRQTRVPTLDVGGTQFRDLIVDETKSPEGMLGLEFLERYLVTLDFPGRRLYLKEGKQLHRRSESNMAGLRVGRYGKDLVAKYVDADGPAFQAGLRPGDVLLELNGKPAGEYDLADMRSLFTSGDGREIAVSFRHGDVRKTGQFKLHRSI